MASATASIFLPPPNLLALYRDLIIIIIIIIYIYIYLFIYLFFLQFVHVFFRMPLFFLKRFYFFMPFECCLYFISYCFYYISVWLFCFMKSSVVIKSFPLVFFDVFPTTCSADSKTFLIWSSFKFAMFSFTSAISREYLFWILMMNVSAFSLTVKICDTFVLSNFSLIKRYFSSYLTVVTAI